MDEVEAEIREAFEKRARILRMKAEYYRYLACLKRIDDYVEETRRGHDTAIPDCADAPPTGETGI